MSQAWNLDTTKKMIGTFMSRNQYTGRARQNYTHKLGVTLAVNTWVADPIYDYWDIRFSLITTLQQQNQRPLLKEYISPRILEHPMSDYPNICVFAHTSIDCQHATLYSNPKNVF